MVKFTVSLADPTFHKFLQLLGAFALGHLIVMYLVRTRRITFLPRNFWAVQAAGYVVGAVFFFGSMALWPAVKP